MTNQTAKTITWNLVVLLIIFVTAELFLGKWKYFADIRDISTCFNKNTHHDYCPYVTHVRVMQKPDGDGIILSHINLSNIRVKAEEFKNSKTNFSEYDVINIGDSFLQADEIPYDKTLSYIMQKNTGVNTLQVGVSSWSSMPMRRWLETHPLKKGVHINFFTMVNDYTQYYGLTNVFYWKESNDQGFFKDKTPSKSTKLSYWETLKKTSFFLSPLNSTPIPPPPKELSIINTIQATIGRDCNELTKYKGKIRESAYNYLEFAFDANCWRQETKDSVDSNIKDFQLIKELIESKYQGSIRFFIIPQGWSLEGENVPGKQMWYYMIGEKTIMTTTGLSEYISQKVTIQNLEPILKGFQKETSEPLYFPIDGHWTQYTHKRIGNWLSK